MDFSSLEEIRTFLEENSEPVESGCREWTGAIRSKKGVHTYGDIYISRNSIDVIPFTGHQGPHRVAYFLNTRNNPGELFVCHHCDNPRCINPDHLFLGTHQDNMTDMSNKGRHPGAPGNKFWMGRVHTPETKEKMRAAKQDHGLGKTNSQYGSCWVYCLRLARNRKIKKTELIYWKSIGWKQGRKMNFHKKQEN